MTLEIIEIITFIARIIMYALGSIIIACSIVLVVTAIAVFIHDQRNKL